MARVDDRVLDQPARKLELRDLHDDSRGGGSQTRRTNQAGHDASPAWSPDGEKLTFATNRTPGGGLNFNIYTMTKTGSNQQSLVIHGAADIFPDW